MVDNFVVFDVGVEIWDRFDVVVEIWDRFGLGVVRVIAAPSLWSAPLLRYSAESTNIFQLAAGKGKQVDGTCSQLTTSNLASRRRQCTASARQNVP